MKVLVTGGAGFIGSNLARDLLASDGFDEVVVIDDLSTGTDQNLVGLDVEFHHASILDEAALGAASRGVDAIVHLAALGSVPRSVLDPLASHEVNATGTLNVLEAARREGKVHVVLASSSSVYGANEQIPKTEEMVCKPMSPYAVSKLATEQYAMAYAQCYGLPVLPFRFFNVYGPGQRAGHTYAAVVPTFLDQALRGVPLTVNGAGDQSRDFTFVGTVTHVIRDCLARRLTAPPTNLAFGTRVDLLALIAKMERVLDRELDVEHRADRPGDVKHSQASNQRLMELLNGVEPVPLEEGLRLTAAWLRAAGV